MGRKTGATGRSPCEWFKSLCKCFNPDADVYLKHAGGQLTNWLLSSVYFPKCEARSHRGTTSLTDTLTYSSLKLSSLESGFPLDGQWALQNLELSNLAVV